MMDKTFGLTRINVSFVLSFSKINIVKHIRNLHVIHVWKRKTAFKRTFPNWDDLTECVKIRTNYTESTKDLMESLKAIYGGISSSSSTLYVEIGWNQSVRLYTRALRKYEIRRKTVLKIRAMTKGKGNYFEH